jgi:hypothetical protein
MLTEEQFAAAFRNATEGWTWEVEGFIDTRGYVYPIDTDTKVISTIFERLSSPALRSIARSHGYVVETANQTTYPDFTLSKYDQNGVLVHRVAVDIKTTYRSNMMGLTLRGYNSFLRNNTKNILHPYDTYHEHWIIGFVYTQNAAFQEYDLDNMPVQGQISCPYSEVVVFVRSKHVLSGVRAGSGNTKNIGSIRVPDPNHFNTQTGPFTQFTRSKDAHDHYWRNYESYNRDINDALTLFNHPAFQVFK